MSHTYYRYNKHDGTSHRSVELESEGTEGFLKMRVFDNMNRPGHGCISLTIEEQNDLVRGILERRGMEVEFTVTGRLVQKNSVFGMDAIDGHSEKQSAVHPANYDKDATYPKEFTDTLQKERDNQNFYVSKYCLGERCMCCGEPAVEKIEQVIFDDNPYLHQHPHTGYLCRKHFDMVLRPYLELRSVTQVAKDEWQKLHNIKPADGIVPETGDGLVIEHPYHFWEYWYKAFQIAMGTNIPPRINHIVARINELADASGYKEGDTKNDYNHGKHTMAHMILDDINEMFYGYTPELVLPKDALFDVGTRKTSLSLEEGVQPWLAVDHQKFYLQVCEDKDHAEWYLRQLVIALNRLIRKSHGRTGGGTEEEVSDSIPKV